jgi:hypothetical protein
MEIITSTQACNESLFDTIQWFVQTFFTHRQS